MYDETTRVAADADAVGRVADRYRRVGRFATHFVAAKLRLDPLTAALLGGPALGRVVDVGCGRGQFGGLLLEAGLAAFVTGLELNRTRLQQARMALAGLSFCGLEQDLARDPRLPPADTVLIADVLYQIAPALQEGFVRAACAAAGSRVLIRTADPGAGWRAGLSRAVEQAGRLISRRDGRAVAPPPVGWIAAILEGSGFAVQVAPSRRGTPFGNVLLTGVRRVSAEAAVARPLARTERS